MVTGQTSDSDARQTGTGERRRRLQRVFAAWQSVQWPVAGALGASALILGTVGFLDKSDGELALPDALYRSIQLFVLESGAIDPPVPAALQIARLLGPFVAGYAAAAAIFLLFRGELDRLRLRWLVRDHVVVCGLGSKGATLARALDAAHVPVAAVELGERRAGTSDRGVATVQGDATDPSVLVRAGLRRAAHVVALCDSESTNAAIAIAASGVRRRRADLVIHVEIDDPRLCAMLRTEALAAGPTVHHAPTEFFTVDERGADRLLDSFPIATDLSGPPRIAIVGLGRFGRRVLVEAARRRRGAADRLKVTVVDWRADERVEEVTQRFPGVARQAEITAIDLDVTSPAFEHGEFLLDEGGGCRIDVAYVCLANETIGLEAGLSLCQAIRRHPRVGPLRPVDVVVSVVRAGGLSSLIGADDTEVARLKVFDLLGSVLNPTLLRAATREAVARALHRAYISHRRHGGAEPGSEPTLLPWDRLSAEVRESNRAAAASVGPNLRAVGCDLTPLFDWDATPIELTPAEVELLSILEHRRWLAWKTEHGFSWSERTDHQHRRNQYLLPWDDLPEAARQWMRGFAVAMPAVLAEADQHVVRLDRSLARSLHEEYLDMRASAGDTPATNPVMVSWEELPRSLKASNHDQAAHIRVKLFAIGCDIARGADGPPFILTADELERLSRMEHDRWVAQRRFDGWTQGPVKDPQKRITPYLVPWEDLSEDIREVDREFVRSMPDLLRRVGLHIVRTD